MSLVLIVNTPDGRVEPHAIGDEICVVGSAAGCDIFLPHEGIDARHAEIRLGEDGSILLEHVGDDGGTYVNERRVDRRALGAGDIVRVGKCEILVQPELGHRVGSALTDKEEEAFFETKVRLHRTLIQRIDLRRLDDDALRAETERTIRGLIRELDNGIPAFVDREQLAKELMEDSLGFGPIEDLLRDPEVSEVMVNRRDRVYVETEGKLRLTDKKFLSDDQIINVIQRIVAPLGRSINEARPMVDARLPDGSRVNAIIPPLAITGPTLTIRKFSRVILDITDLVERGSLSWEMARFLRLCVEYKRNAVISGGAGSGKTTLLNILGSFIPTTERVITVEDAAELSLPQEHLVSLEARPSNIEGKGEVTFRALVINSLRMRPDRIIVGECRGGEAVDMLQAMNTGHEGSLTTIHANSPVDALSRLETMVLMSGLDLPSRAIRDQIMSAVNIVVQTRRFSDGSRKIVAISEVSSAQPGEFQLVDLFHFEQRRIDEKQRIVGEFVRTGVRPRLVDLLRGRGLDVPWGEAG